MGFRVKGCLVYEDRTVMKLNWMEPYIMCLTRHHIAMLTFSRNSLSLLSPTNHTAASLQTSVVTMLIKWSCFTIQIRQNGKHEISLHASTERQILRKIFCIANVHKKHCFLYLLDYVHITAIFEDKILLQTNTSTDALSTSSPAEPTLSWPRHHLNRTDYNIDIT